MIEDTEGNVRAIRNFMIKSLNNYMRDMDFMRNVVLQNEHAFESKDDILEQFNRVKNELKSILDYNFYKVEIEHIENIENGIE